MKKNIIIVGVLFVAAAISVLVCASNEKSSMENLFHANVEALANDETATIPCVQAVSICHFIVKDANGYYYNASATGMRNVE